MDTVDPDSLLADPTAQLDHQPTLEDHADDTPDLQHGQEDQAHSKTNQSAQTQTPKTVRETQTHNSTKKKMLKKMLNKTSH